MLDGISRRTLVSGEKTLMAEFKLAKGNTLPKHKHPHEQIAYLLSGCLIFDVNGQETEIRAGDSWCFPGNVEHSAVAVDDSIALEVFSPVREDYL